MYYFTSSIIYGSNKGKYFELGMAGLLSLSELVIYYGFARGRNIAGADIVELNTPTHCCTGRCKKCCHPILTFISMLIIAFFLACLSVIIPKVTFVYFLYPTRTLARLPFLITAFIYINSTIALLIFYFENALYVCIEKRGWFGAGYSKKNIEKEYHMSHYDLTTSKCMGIFATIGILFLLMYVVLAAIVLGGLAFTHSNNFKDNQLETLIGLLPSLFLLLGSLHKRDLFIVDQEDENKANSTPGNMKTGNEKPGSTQTGSERSGSTETGSGKQSSTRIESTKGDRSARTGRDSVAVEMEQPDEETGLLRGTINNAL